MTRLGTYTQAQSPDQQQDGVLLGNVTVATSADETRLPAASNNVLQDDIDAHDGMVPANSEQGFDFDDNMDTNAWEWSRLLNLSPAEDAFPPGNES